MDFPAEITIEGRPYTYVDTQRGGLSAIYTSGATFLRIGAPEKISQDLAFHKRMESFGYPVPKLLGEGTIDSYSYFIEDSLGDTHFGYLFRDEVKEYGSIRDATFSAFTEVCLSFARAQIHTITDEKDWGAFEAALYLEDLCEEIPEAAEKIRRHFERVKENLSVFPFALCHGDLTPLNMYPKGVIDFEDSFVGPIGYDLGALIEHLNWFPLDSDEYEYYRLYDFTPEQKSGLTAQIDELYQQHGLPKLSDHLADLDFAKGVWFAVRLGRAPKLEEFRHSLIKELVKDAVV